MEFFVFDYGSLPYLLCNRKDAYFQLSFFFGGGGDVKASTNLNQIFTHDFYLE